jgi:hypothetical protein
MSTELKEKLFEHCRQSLAAAELTTVSERALICPLCWQETPYGDMSLEHAVPGAVGGKYTTLTCRRCNNDQGAALDSHVANFQTIIDTFKGHGALPVTLDVNGKRMAANLKWGDGSKDFHVVAKASNPKEVAAIQQDFKAGLVPELSFSFSYGYALNLLNTALLRAAYLVLFKCFGYEYARHEIIQSLRRRICDTSLDQPQLGPLMIQLQNGELPYDEPHLIAPGNVNGVEFFLVILRLKKETTTWRGVYMPIPGERDAEFFGLMEQCSREHNGERLTLPRKAIFT